jgi:hypothetical protein
MPEAADIGALAAGDFEPHVGSTFRLLMQQGEVGLELIEVRKLGPALREGGAFALLFVSQKGPFLPQATYALSHPELGLLELFIVPIGPVGRGNGYEAVFT